MATANQFFVFGPSQSYVAQLPPIGISYSENLSPALVEVIVGNHVKNLHFVAFMGDQSNAEINADATKLVSQAYVGYDKKSFAGAGKLYSPPDTAFTLPGFETWVKQQSDKTEGMQVVCNGKGAYWANSTKSSCRDGVTREQLQWMKGLGPHGVVKSFAFGINDSFVVIYDDGHVTWDLKGSYEELDKRLQEILGQSTELSYISLDPYDTDNYFCIFGDSSCAFRFPETERFETIRNLILERSYFRVIIDSPTLKHSTDKLEEPVEPEEEKPSFAETVVKDVAMKEMEDRLQDMLNSSFAN
jgi:hypothetical protein